MPPSPRFRVSFTKAGIPQFRDRSGRFAKVAKRTRQRLLKSAVRPRVKKRRVKPGPGKPSRHALPPLRGSNSYNKPFKKFLEPLGKRGARQRAIIIALLRVPARDVDSFTTNFETTIVPFIVADAPGMVVSRAMRLTDEDIIQIAADRWPRVTKVIGVYAMRGKASRKPDALRGRIAKRFLKR